MSSTRIDGAPRLKHRAYEDIGIEELFRRVEIVRRDSLNRLTRAGKLHLWRRHGRKATFGRARLARSGNRLVG